MKDYGELMNLLLYFRERYPGDEEFRRFVIDSIRTFIYDLRDFDVEISLSPDSTQRRPVNNWRAPPAPSTAEPALGR